MEIKGIFLHQSPTNRWFRNGIQSLLKRADARGSADIIYRILYVRHRKSRSRREYLILTDNIIVLDHFFYLIKKYNLIGRL